MRGRGEQGVVQQVFPIAGEFAPGNHLRIERMLDTPMTNDDHAVAHRRGRGGAALDGRYIQTSQRQDQPEAGDLVIGEGMSGYDGPVTGREPDRFSLGDEVADGEYQSIGLDHGPVTDALGS